MAHLIRCACTPDNMWYVETFIWLCYKAAQGILPIDQFVKPIKCLTSTRRNAGCMWTLRERGPAGAVSGFARGGEFVVAILIHWRTWCELIVIRCGGVAIGWFRVPITSQRAGRDDRHGRGWSKACRSGNDSFRSEVLLLAFFQLAGRGPMLRTAKRVFEFQSSDSRWKNTSFFSNAIFNYLNNKIK